PPSRGGGSGEVSPASSGGRVRGGRGRSSLAGVVALAQATNAPATKTATASGPPNTRRMPDEYKPRRRAAGGGHRPSPGAPARARDRRRRQSTERRSRLLVPLDEEAVRIDLRAPGSDRRADPAREVVEIERREGAVDEADEL